ncbi:hypothetical protein TNIN_336511 [Trichonephila inaurata madagascariensis]|uniref:Uncharacterized protein n=1 Tax=Trichonephila inaurata madagascariensis TaxID=2747483 RepID=A0A8X6YDG7_9ARAC|nr:hypothetical protein TNIN_336511 [Trichonephila inaurata madagascariensis]
MDSLDATRNQLRTFKALSLSSTSCHRRKEFVLQERLLNVCSTESILLSIEPEIPVPQLHALPVCLCCHQIHSPQPNLCLVTWSTLELAS